MAPLGIGRVDFGPWRGQKNRLVTAVGYAQFFQDRFSGEVLKRCRRIDQPAIEKHPAGLLTRRCMVGDRHLDRAARKGHHVDPGQGCAVAFKFLLDDAPAGLFDDGMTAGNRLLKQRRFPAAGTSRHQDRPVHVRAPA
ncbi:hypothetical protein ACVIOG_003263 [Rhizobium leguminosarum]